MPSYIKVDHADLVGNIKDLPAEDLPSLMITLLQTCISKGVWKLGTVHTVIKGMEDKLIEYRRGRKS